MSGLKNKITEETHYRLRHLNTGRLVIDQEIEWKGIKIRTLGLAPHLEAKCLSTVQDRHIDGIANDMKNFDHPENFQPEDLSPKAPKTFEEIERRSRFRIISTSPSLDQRIISNSCV